MVCGIDRSDRALAQVGPGLLREHDQREAPYICYSKWRRHSERPIRKIRLRCDELERHAVFRECVQREDGFQGRHTAARYDDVKAVTRSRRRVHSASLQSYTAWSSNARLRTRRTLGLSPPRDRGRNV